MPSMWMPAGKLGNEKGFTTDKVFKWSWLCCKITTQFAEVFVISVGYVVVSRSTGMLAVGHCRTVEYELGSSHCHSVMTYPHTRSNRQNNQKSKISSPQKFLVVLTNKSLVRYMRICRRNPIQIELFLWFQTNLICIECSSWDDPQFS